MGLGVVLLPFESGGDVAAVGRTECVTNKYGTTVFKFSAEVKLVLLPV